MTAITPFGWTPQTSAPAQPLNAARPVNGPYGSNRELAQQQRAQQQQMPRWYSSLMNMGKQQYASGGGVDPAGLQSGADWFSGYYGGYTGSVPVQPGLLGAAAQGLAGNKAFREMGVDSTQAYGLASNYLNQYAQNGMNGGGNWRGGGNINGGLSRYLSDLGFQQQNGPQRGLLG